MLVSRLLDNQENSCVSDDDNVVLVLQWIRLNRMEMLDLETMENVL